MTLNRVPLISRLRRNALSPLACRWAAAGERVSGIWRAKFVNISLTREAAKYIAQFGKNHYYNVIDGFEGNMDSQAQRNNKDGWKFNKLPWSQS